VQPAAPVAQPEAHAPLPENPGTAPQFGTEQPASVPVPEVAEEAPKRRSTVREAPPAMKFEDTPATSSVYERTESAPLAPENTEQAEAAPAPAPASAPKKGWWRR
jgi:hypothetical protein